MRCVQPVGQKGSLKWIQHAVGLRPDLLCPVALDYVVWKSPVVADDFAEYRDADFLDRLGQSRLAADLMAFWPARGPQWDALGLSNRGPVLVEAKAHIAEFASPPSAAKATSRAQIDAAFRKVKQDLAPDATADWSQRYYQYANRLAHLWWFHQHGVLADLIFVGFLGDVQVKGPTRAEEWSAAFDAADKVLGLECSHALTPFIHHLYPDIRQFSDNPDGH